MAFADKNIYFQDDFRFELIGSTVKNFIVFSIKKNDYQAMLKHDNKHSFETFLLIKALPDCPLQKNIVFTKEKLDSDEKQTKLSQSQYLKSESYVCSFLRHVDLLYCKKLNQSLEILNIHTQIPLENQWFILYEVHAYKPAVEKLIKYELRSPNYGGEVLISNESDKKRAKQSATISNLFRFGSQNIYFVNDCLEIQHVKDMSVVLSADKISVYGLTLKIKDEISLIPLNMILFQKPCETIIDKNLLTKLEKTCYVEFFGSYCTGIVIDEHKIITARHLLPKYQQKIGTKVTVKLFPFKQNIVGSVKKIGTGSLDIMEIELLDKQVDTRINSGQKLKTKQFVKQQLLGSLIQQSGEMQKNTSMITFKPNLTKSLFQAQQIPKKKYIIGDQITALGFGKLQFNASIFSKFELVFPTVAVGVVSKVISINDSDIFLKTDALLYSGFSGCGIWKQEMIAMAVFILRNKTTSSNYNRHNFSYTSEFIEKLIKTHKKELISSLNEQIAEFDQIKTRHDLNLIDLPHPKL